MKILIVGAGIAGLALARRLDQLQQKYTLIERSPGWSQDGAGICLPANAVAGLEKLGLKDELLQLSYAVQKIKYVKPNGHLLSSASLLTPPFNDQPFLALPRAKLLALLRKGMENKVTFNTSPRNIEQLDKGVRVTFSDSRIEEFDCVIGADGINSQVRELTFNQPELEDLQVTNWRFLIDQPTADLQPTYYLGSDSFFMRYPMPDNKVYCYAHVLDKDHQWTKLQDKQWLLKRFKGFEDKVVEAIQAVACDEDIIPGRLQSVVSREVYSGSVLLIGDALHGCPPALQQGVGMGLEDVHCLADLLDKHQDLDTIFNLFKQQRLERISWVIDESNRIIKLASKGRTFLGRVIRNFVVRKGGPANVNGWRKLLQWES
ncbi:FAD-dependent monooxygenase [Shewanella woodyi]|uniref:FAD-dependent monooxygenase n=1 Tax=Shewanella woodyi TaxID=60961 RepID=UPI0037479B0F